MRSENKNKNKKIAALALAVVMAFLLAACGGKQETVSTVEQKEYTYVPEYIEIEDSENADFYNMQVKGSSIYYFNYTYDEETGISQNTIREYSLETQETRDFPVAFENNVQSYVIDDQGSVATIEVQWIQEEDSQKYFLCRYDAQGNQTVSQDITDIVVGDNDYGYISSFLADAQGRFYASADDKVLLFDGEGNYQGEVTLDGSWIQGIGVGKDGKAYVTYYDSASETGGYVLAEVSFEEKKLGTSYKNFPNGSGNGELVKGIEGDFLVNDGSRVYEYSMESQSADELFAWVDSDINGTYVNYMGTLDDGRLFAVINDWNTNETEIAFLTKTKSSELPEKIQLTIGTLYDSQSLQAAAVEFNKQSDTYHVSIKTYIDQNNWTENSWNDGITKLNNDIISGSNCPDILDLSSLSIEQLSAKGVLEDLNPYFEKSTVVSKDDYLESIVEAYTYDGKLISMPKTFSLTTLAGKSSEVGTEMGWTLEEMIAYAEANPDAVLLDYASKTNIMYTLLNYNQESFVDWSTGECSFDSEEFKLLLEFVSSFPDELDWESDQRSTPLKLQAGDVLLESVYVSELNTIQTYDAMFGEDVTFIGYPNSEGTSGCYLTGSEVYGIAAKSANKDGAWAFIESYLSQGADSAFSYGLPSNKTELDNMIAEAVKVEYILDENGEPMLDENGEPIPANGGGGMSYGDWEYTYHIPTQEEADRLMELIEAAQPASNADQEIMTIINEEAQAFFQGQKSADDVAAVIQSRVQVYVNENS